MRFCGWDEWEGLNIWGWSKREGLWGFEDEVSVKACVDLGLE